jgi:hypothetical protein
MLLPSEEAKEGVGEEGSCPTVGGKRKPGLLGLRGGDRDGCCVGLSWTPALTTTCPLGDWGSSGEVGGSIMAGTSVLLAIICA